MVREKVRLDDEDLVLEEREYQRSDGTHGVWTLAKFDSLFSGAILASAEEIKSCDYVIFTDVVVRRAKDGELKNSVFCVPIKERHLSRLESVIQIQIAKSEAELQNSSLSLSAKESSTSVPVRSYSRVIAPSITGEGT